MKYKKTDKIFIDNWNYYEQLPNDIKQLLFKYHDHFKDGEIYYVETDIMEIIKYILQK